ncbi:DUF1194 domain-containing protein [Mesorhizobium sp. M1163]|uniref:DUF1194 domain-containing protein n=1 Tax=Mesorhizobium sp. M1163 TaxID=2957065 RepID=UPI003335D17B
MRCGGEPDNVALGHGGAGFLGGSRTGVCVDVSSSTSETEQRLQREGYVNALLDAEVLQSIRIRPAW